MDAAATRWLSASSISKQGRASSPASDIPVDPDLIFRSLAYAIEPEWTQGHRFAVAYQLVGEGGGSWRVEVDDGTVRVERAASVRAPMTRPDSLHGLAPSCSPES